MIQLMKRILAVSGRYKRRIQIAFVFSFLKSLLAKAPIMLAFLVLSSFYEGTITAGDCLWYGIALVVCVLLQVLFHHIADRLQSAAGFLVFSDMRMDLGAHLRRMPMGYFTEGNIGKISSVLSSDMVFIEENCMTVLADMMSYIFAQAILVVFLLCFDLWIGLAALAIIGIVLLIARGNIAAAVGFKGDPVAFFNNGIEIGRAVVERHRGDRGIGCVHPTDDGFIRANNERNITEISERSFLSHFLGSDDACIRTLAVHEVDVTHRNKLGVEVYASAILCDSDCDSEISELGSILIEPTSELIAFLLRSSRNFERFIVLNLLFINYLTAIVKRIDDTLCIRGENTRGGDRVFRQHVQRQ